MSWNPDQALLTRCQLGRSLKEGCMYYEGERPEKAAERHISWTNTPMYE